MEIGPTKETYTIEPVESPVPVETPTEAPEAPVTPVETPELIPA